MTARFGLTYVDRMPLGDIVSTMHSLITMHEDTDFLYRYTYDADSFVLDTRELREILGGVPFSVPEVSQYIRDFLQENETEVTRGRLI